MAGNEQRPHNMEGKNGWEGRETKTKKNLKIHKNQRLLYTPYRGYWCWEQLRTRIFPTQSQQLQCRELKRNATLPFKYYFPYSCSF